jgi:hypothetical protein
MRILVVFIAAALLSSAACTGKMAPGQPLDNITAHNTENTGDWRVTGIERRDRRIVLRVAADQPQNAELIARKAIDQQLASSPVEILVDVFPSAGQTAVSAAHVVWQRPANIPLQAPAAPDPRGAVSSDRQGSPERAVGAHDR